MTLLLNSVEHSRTNHMIYCLMSICLQGVFTCFMGVGILVHSSDLDVLFQFIY